MLKSIVYFASIVVILSSTLSESAEVRIAVTDWPPYYSKQLPGGGQQLELLNQVFKKLNQSMEPVWFRTGTGALVKTKAGLLDAAAGWECNKIRAEDFLFSDPIGFEQTGIFHHKSFVFDWHDIGDFNQDITIGITSRYAYGSNLQKLLAMEKPKVEISGSDRHNLDLLYNREIDLFLLDQAVGLALIKSSGETLAKHLVLHPKPFRADKVAIRLLVPKKKTNATNFIRSFNKALAEIRTEKRLFELAPDQFSSCSK